MSMPEFNEIRKEMVESVREGKTGPDNAPDNSQRTADDSHQSFDSSSDIGSSEASQEPTARELQQIVELDKLEKWKFKGEEWDQKKLNESILRQSDYTKKTQELAKDRKFLEALPADLVKISQNPALKDQFLKVYPQKFHGYLKLVKEEQSFENTGQKGQDYGDSEEFMGQLLNHPALKSKLSKIDAFEEFYREVTEKAASQEIESRFNSLYNKYKVPEDKDLRDIVDVMTTRRLELMREDGEDLTEEVWDKVFKETYDKLNTAMGTKYKQTINEQKAANLKATDMAAGGGIPGNAPKKLDLKDVKKTLMKEIASGRA